MQMIALLALAAVAAPAQEIAPVDPIAHHTFPPELVMRHQRAIALTEEQRTEIKRELQTAQSSFTDLQWDLERELETFVALLEPGQVDEKRAIAALEEILSLESAIKKSQLLLAIRVKNLLSAEQEERLRDLAPRGPAAPAPDHPRRGAEPRTK